MLPRNVYRYHYLYLLRWILKTFSTSVENIKRKNLRFIFIEDYRRRTYSKRTVLFKSFFINIKTNFFRKFLISFDKNNLETSAIMSKHEVILSFYVILIASWNFTIFYEVYVFIAFSAWFYELHNFWLVAQINNS